MANKQYTFSLPPEASAVIDAMPKMAKSDYVARALLEFKREESRKKTLDVIALLKPKHWETAEDSVSLVQSARAGRATTLGCRDTGNDE